MGWRGEDVGVGRMLCLRYPTALEMMRWLEERQGCAAWSKKDKRRHEKGRARLAAWQTTTYSLTAR